MIAAVLQAQIPALDSSVGRAPDCPNPDSGCMGLNLYLA